MIVMNTCFEMDEQNDWDEACLPRVVIDGHNSGFKITVLYIPRIHFGDCKKVPEALR